MRLDHVAVAVRSVDAAADRLCALFGYLRKTATVTNTRQRVKVLFLQKPDSIDIKLIEPSDPEAPLADFVRRGGGLHHVCFKVSDVQEASAMLAERGVRITAAPAPGEAFDDHLIAFCYAGFGLSVELIDTDVRRSLLAASETGSDRPTER
jgi:methylmalonyl-CoA/ethylmalonyl-CoA epimerase